MMISVAALPRESWASRPSCQESLWGFNIYERLEKGRIEERHSVFPVQEWSNDSAFEGILTKEKKASVLEIEVMKENGKSIKAQSWPFKSWEISDKYRKADGLDTKTFFFGVKAGSAFVLRLKQGGKVLCESKALPVYGGD